MKSVLDNDLLFVGSNKASRNYEKLMEKGIKVIINASGGENALEDKGDFSYHKFDFNKDTKQIEMDKLFREYCDIVESCVDQEKPVYTYCKVGVNESITLVMSYLMKNNDWDYDETYQYLRKKKKITLDVSGSYKAFLTNFYYKL